MIGISFLWNFLKPHKNIKKDKRLVDFISEIMIKHPSISTSIIIMIIFVTSIILLQTKIILPKADTYYWYYSSILQGFVAFLALIIVMYIFKLSEIEKGKNLIIEQLNRISLRGKNDKIYKMTVQLLNEQKNEREESEKYIKRLFICILTIVTLSIFGILTAESDKMIFNNIDFKIIFLVVTFGLVTYTLAEMSTFFGNKVIRKSR